MQKLSLFRLIFFGSRWLHERLSATGLALVIMTAFAGALGLNTETNLAHMVFALGFCFIAVDAGVLLLQRWRMPPLSARRHLPEFVTVGEPLRYRVSLRNDGKRPSRVGLLAERMLQGWPTALPSQQPKRRPRMSYPAFLQRLRRLRALDVQWVAVARLLPGQSCEVALPALPTARGVASFQSLRLVLNGPLGLAQWPVPVTVASARLVVLPRRHALDLPPAIGHRLLEPRGIALAQRVGDAEEFRSLRDYRPGDPMRSIHWRSFARTGKPVVREFQEEFFSRHTLVLDTASAQADSPAFELAVSMAAWLVVRPREGDSLLDLLFVGDRVHRVTSGRSLGGADSLLRVLATVAPTPADSIGAVLATLERNAAQVSSVVAIFQVWDPPRQAAVRRLMARGLRPTVLVVDTTGQVPPEPDEAAFVGIVRRVAVAVMPLGAMGV